jgi:hypothetical protein
MTEREMTQPGRQAIAISRQSNISDRRVFIIMVRDRHAFN